MSLTAMARWWSVPNANYWGFYGEVAGADGPKVFATANAGILLLARGTVQGIVDNLGWTKKQVQAHLWEKSKLTPVEVKEYGLQGALESLLMPKNGPLPVASKPEQLMIVVAGGAQSGHCYLMQVGVGTRIAKSAEIKLPARWNELMKQAEKDLGPIPA